MRIGVLLKKYRDIIVYGIFGLLSTMVNIVSYWILAHVLGIEIMPSTILAWIIAVTFAYLTNRVFVFQSMVKDKQGICKEIYSFFGCRLGSEFIDIIAMFVFVTQLQCNDMLVKSVANIMVIIVNYVASKWLIFKK